MSLCRSPSGDKHSQDEALGAPGCPDRRDGYRRVRARRMRSQHEGTYLASSLRPRWRPYCRGSSRLAQDRDPKPRTTCRHARHRLRRDAWQSNPPGRSVSHQGGRALGRSRSATCVAGTTRAAAPPAPHSQRTARATAPRERHCVERRPRLSRLGLHHLLLGRPHGTTARPR